MSATHPPLIALFLGDLEMGGAERVFVTLARQFVQRGYRVRLILAHKTGPLLDELDPAVEVIDLQAARPGQSPWLFALRTLFALRRHLRDSPPQALLSTLTGANLIAILARALSGRAFCLVIREAVTLTNLRSGVRLKAMRRLYPRADRIVALTGTMKTELSTALNLPAARIEVIGNPLDTHRIAQLLDDLTEHQRAQPHAPYWLAIGRLVAQKDFSTLIEAAARLGEDEAPRIVILGDGPLLPVLRAQISQHKLEHRVILAGFIANPYPWLANAAGFVLSSRWEGYPNVLLEALHFKLPIVATRYDDSVAELLDPHPGAPHRIVPVGDPQGMADAIRDLMSTQPSPSSPETKTARGSSTTSLQHVADRYLALLRPSRAGAPS